jgi:alpha-tubulin suppressor-like RCC1 family protein
MTANTALVGGTVNVAAGIYSESIIINKPLTLNGAKAGIDARSRATNSGESVLDGAGLQVSQHDAIIIANGVSNVVIDGFEVRNYNINSTSNGDGNAISSYCMSSDLLGTSNITVKNNYIHDLGYNGILVGSENNSAETMVVQSGWTIQYNRIAGCKYAGIELTNVINSKVKDNCISAPANIFDDPGDAGVGIEIAARSRSKPVTAGTDVEVSGNTITGTFPAGSRAAINMLSRTYSSTSNAILSGITVNGNSISGAVNVRAAILLVAESRMNGPATIGDMEISGNILDGNRDAIDIQDYVKNGSGAATHSSITVSDNEIKNSTAVGLRLLPNTSATGITVDSNRIVSNAVSGIRNEGTGALAASSNWFGSAVRATVQAKVYGYVSVLPYFIDNEMIVLSNVKKISTFNVSGQKGTTAIDETNHTISLTVPYGTDVTSLAPSVTYAGSSVTPASGSVNNFTSPQAYTVTAFDEATTQAYTATVNVNTGITASSGTNGSITPSGAVDVNPGANQYFEITAAPNYHVSDVLVDGVSVGAVTSYQFTNVIANHTISAGFTINTYAVTFYLAGKGTRNGGGALSQTVNYGSAATAPSVAANTGWIFTAWDKSFTNVTADMTVTAQYSPDTYTLTYLAGPHGSMTGPAPQTVAYGMNGSQVTAVPDAGYHFVSWSDGLTTASRTDMNVTANKTVTASFAINTYTITYAAGFHGTITGTAIQTVNYGANGTAVTATPDTGYHFVSWSDDMTTASRTETNVVAGITVTASFAINTYTVTFAEGVIGTITGTKTQYIDHGSSTFQVTAVPSTRYHFVNWAGDVTSTSNPLTVSNVTSNMTITAYFALNPTGLHAMGHNGYGQLGDNTLTNRTSPVEILSSGVTAAATGYYHSLFIKSDDSLWAMGDNAAGQLGDGTTIDRKAPVQIVSSGVVAVSAGNYHSLFIKSDGSLWAMGENGDGQLGDGTIEWKSTPVRIVTSGVVAISAGAWHSLFLKADGSLWGMGNNSEGALGDGTTTNRNTPVQVLSSGVSAISAGYWHSLYLKTDGSVWGMGSNGAGQLGDGTATGRITPVMIMSSGVGAISASAGGYHSMFLKTNGSLWSAGSNGYGQLGDGSNDWRFTPVQIVSSGVTSVSAGAYHTMFIKSDGSLWAMGWNSNGQLGDGTTTNRNTPVQILSSAVNAVSSGFEHSLFLLENGN